MKKLLKRPFFRPGASAARDGIAQHGAVCQRYAFFSPREAALMEAIVARLIPDDVLGAGALEAGVPAFIDRQLAGPWGATMRLYRKPGGSDLDERLECSPAELFHRALRGIQAQLERDRLELDQMTGRQLDNWLARLQEDESDLDGAPAIAFFECVWSLTLEGYFTDLDAEGDLDVLSWKLLSFLGDEEESHELSDAFSRGAARGSRGVSIQAGWPESSSGKRH